MRLLMMAMMMAMAAMMPARVLAAIDAPVTSPVASPVWKGPDGQAPAVSGHDVVAYFGGAAVPGDPAIAAEHEGARYLFSSIANRDSFLAEPARYLPQYGGHCAWAASQGRAAGPDPKVFIIEDGKLYLNCSKAAEENWLAGQPGLKAQAAAWWAAKQAGSQPGAAKD
jgi:YHS domain-containing protein